MKEWHLQVVYGLLIVAASLLGGYAPYYLRLTHRRMQVALSFVAGLLLGIGLLHLIPHAYFNVRLLDRVMLTALAGFLVMFFLQRIFHFHTHEPYVPENAADAEVTSPETLNSLLPVLPPVVPHDHGPHCDHDHDHSMPTGKWTWVGVFFGLAVHTIIDGLALGAAVRADWDHADPQKTWLFLAGFGYFLAVVLHKPFDSLSISSLMHLAGWSRKAVFWVNFSYALIAPLGVLLFYYGLQESPGRENEWLGGTLAFAAGACLCISTSDLLPELQFHSHDRLKLSLALLLGIALAWGLVFIEEHGHDHSHGHQHSHAGHKH